jgi:P3 major capsid protein
MPQAQGQQAQASPQSLNGFARAAIVNGVMGTDGMRKGPAVKRAYQISGGGNFVPANTPQITITPSNVGLLLGFWVEVQLTVSNTSGFPIQLTDLGPANALAQIQLNDLQNNTRIQCPGWLVALSNSVRNHGQPFGSAMPHNTATDSPINWGSVFANQISAPSQIATGTSGVVTMWYYVPVAYSDEDLRGVIYINVLNSTVQLILNFAGNGGTVGQNGVTICQSFAGDGTQAVYQATNAGATLANVTQTNALVNIWQVFYDSIPKDPKYGLLVPVIDASTVYELKQTTLSAIVANQDFPYQYPNYRDILSTFLVYVNNPTGGVRTGGVDMNYLQLLTANFTAIWKKTPALVALETRNLIGTDMPPGMYYLNTRRKPINSTQFGNIQIIINPLTANAGAYLMVGIEDFAVQQALSIAGSLAAS